jgi:outer membrane receptor for ferric coprogen and ferric-rhodotorulic acid
VFYAFDNGHGRLAVNVDNLAHQHYYPPSDGDNNISPGGSRNARLTYFYTF